MSEHATQSLVAFRTVCREVDRMTSRKKHHGLVSQTTEEYLAAGGKITQLPSCLQADQAEIFYSLTFNPYAQVCKPKE